MSIYILSRPIRSGKTTELLQTFVHRPHVVGIAMPDVNGSRHFYDFASQSIYPVEADEQPSTDNIFQVGRFRFLAEAFSKANRALLAASNQTQGWILIDEVGKLELQDSGLHEGVEKILSEKEKVLRIKREDGRTKYAVPCTKVEAQNPKLKIQNLKEFEETSSVNILIVVRDSLLWEVIEKYGLKDAIVLEQLSRL